MVLLSLGSTTWVLPSAPSVYSHSVGLDLIPAPGKINFAVKAVVVLNGSIHPEWFFMSYSTL